MGDARRAAKAALRRHAAELQARGAGADGVPAPGGDEDGDRLANTAELAAGLDPRDSDNDDDGALDGWDNCPLVSDPAQKDRDGELVMTPSPTAWHQEVAIELASRLLAHILEHELGKVFSAPLDVTLDEHNAVRPDIFFVSTDQAGILQGERIVGAGDLCVEILSPGTERIARVHKLSLYALVEVTHYRIVDLEARTIEEYALSGDAYRVRSVALYDEPFRPAAFPRFEFTLSVVPLASSRRPEVPTRRGAALTGPRESHSTRQ